MGDGWCGLEGGKGKSATGLTDELGACEGSDQICRGV